MFGRSICLSGQYVWAVNMFGRSICLGSQYVWAVKMLNYVQFILHNMILQ